MADTSSQIADLQKSLDDLKKSYQEDLKRQEEERKAQEDKQADLTKANSTYQAEIKNVLDAIQNNTAPKPQTGTADLSTLISVQQKQLDTLDKQLSVQTEITSIIIVFVVMIFFWVIAKTAFLWFYKIFT